jgi:hypothetical protein
MQILKIGKKFDVGVRLISSKTAGIARKTQSRGNQSAQFRLEVDPDYPIFFMPPDSQDNRSEMPHCESLHQARRVLTNLHQRTIAVASSLGGRSTV